MVARPGTDRSLVFEMTVPCAAEFLLQARPGYQELSTGSSKRSTSCEQTSCLGPLRKQRVFSIRCSVDCQFSNGFPILTCLMTDLNGQDLGVWITFTWPYCDA